MELAEDNEVEDKHVGSVARAEGSAVVALAVAVAVPDSF